MCGVAIEAHCLPPMDDTPPSSTCNGIRLARIAGVPDGRGGWLRYSIRVLGAWSIPLALGLGLGAWRFLIVDFAPLVLAATVVLAVVLGLLVLWTGRRAAMRVLGASDSRSVRVAWVLVPPSLRLWNAVGGRGSGGVVNEWVLVVRDDECVMARGSSLAQVRLVTVDVEPHDIDANPTAMQLSCADRSATVRLYWPRRTLAG